MKRIVALLLSFLCVDVAFAIEIRTNDASHPDSPPIHINSNVEDNRSIGAVDGELMISFDKFRSEFSRLDQWCEFLWLHLNVKSCESKIVHPNEAVLKLYVGRKEFQKRGDASVIVYRQKVVQNNAKEIAFELSADSGPYGTTDYRISVRAQPTSSGNTAVAFTYSYRFNWASRFAFEAYSNTLGREKVGFSLAVDGDSSATRVSGIRGAVERNAMRYFLAIQSYLETVDDTSQDRLKKRLHRWHQLTQRYTAQLNDLEENDYVRIKLLERASNWPAATAQRS